jgi:hypothetical protein
MNLALDLEISLLGFVFVLKKSYVSFFAMGFYLGVPGLFLVAPMNAKKPTCAAFVVQTGSVFKVCSSINRPQIYPAVIRANAVYMVNICLWPATFHQNKSQAVRIYLAAIDGDAEIPTRMNPASGLSF